MCVCVRERERELNAFKIENTLISSVEVSRTLLKLNKGKEGLGGGGVERKKKTKTNKTKRTYTHRKRRVTNGRQKLRRTGKVAH